MKMKVIIMATWKGIKISEDTYERMKNLSEALGLSMDAIIRELTSYSDAETGNTLVISSADEFYAFLRHAREGMKQDGWTTQPKGGKG